MKTYNIAIVEDESHYIDELKKNLNYYGDQNKVTFNITVFYDGYDLLDHYHLNFDIIFLDIELKQLNGFETAKEIRKIDNQVIIIFVTNMIDFAVKGYEVDAQSFLIKPVQNIRFSREITKALQMIDKKTKYIMINTNNGMMKIALNDILYIESNRHELFIITHIGEFSIWGTLKEYENNLIQFHFYRCSNSFIVNLAKVENISGEIVTIKNKQIKISRARKKGFMEVLTKYYQGGM